MGCTASKVQNPVDVALIQALREAKARRTQQQINFNELLLKFPKVQQQGAAQRQLLSRRAARPSGPAAAWHAAAAADGLA